MLLANAKHVFFLVYSYNLIKGNWFELPRLSPERGYHGVSSIEGEMYVVGGFNNPTSDTLDTGGLFNFKQAYNINMNPVVKQCTLNLLIVFL